MKDVFTSRCVNEFGSLVVDFADSLDESLKRDDVHAWSSHVRVASPEELIKAWNSAITTPMSRQHAKYVRAVSSITNDATLVYHAINYRDVSAIDACHCPLTPLRCADCVRDLSVADCDLFWKYMRELTNLCYKWTQMVPPPIPTTEQISKDIEHRRAQRDRPSSSSVVANTSSPATSEVKGLTSGVDDLWMQLCQKRGVTVPITSAIRDRIRECVRSDVTGDVLHATFPDLGDAPYTPDQLSVAERMKNLVTMDDAIPSDMMKGIEAVANRLVKDINSGRCDLASLDIESIGQQVISGVNEDDMSKFASNLDKIIPALQRAHQG